MPTRVKINSFSFDVSFDTFNNELESGGFEQDSQIRILSYSAFNQLQLIHELDGKTNYLQDIALLSLINKCIVFCGITTTVKDINHISVAIFNSGRLIDIVDRTLSNADDGFESSDKIKIFSTDYGKIGLLIDKDALLLSNWQKVAPHCDCILCIAKTDEPEFSDAALSLSTQFDIPFVLVANNTVSWSEKSRNI